MHIVLCALTGDANSIAATFNIPVHCARYSLCTHGRCQQYCCNLQYSCSLCTLFSVHSRDMPTVLLQPLIFLFIVHIVLCALTGDANSIAATFNVPVHCAHCSLCTHGRCQQYCSNLQYSCSLCRLFSVHSRERPTVLQQPSIFLFIVHIVLCALTGEANSIAATFNIPVHCADCFLCTHGRGQQYCSNLQYSCSLCTLFSVHSRERPTVLQQPSIFLFIVQIVLCALTGEANSIAATFNIPSSLCRLFSVHSQEMPTVLAI